MNILLIEDNEQYLNQFSKQLSKIGTIFSFKSSNGSGQFLDNTDIEFDLIVCDHNILRFEHESSRHMATGDEIYDEVRLGMELNIPFIHFSAEPCPENYMNSQKDSNFYILKKTSNTDLVDFIQQKVLSK